MPLNSSSKPKSIGIKICIPKYESIKHSGWLKPAVYKCLDIILGEKQFSMDVDFVDIGDLPEKPEEKGMIELFELSRFINWKKKQINKN